LIVDPPLEGYQHHCVLMLLSPCVDSHPIVGDC